MTKKIYQIQVTLKDSKPKIWRRILVPPDLLLSNFHKIIQTTMGWTNTHLHHFIKGRTFFTKKFEVDDFWGEMENVDYADIKVTDLLKRENEKIQYEYDFGDYWVHDILLEKILPAEQETNYPVCVKGKRNCPPEDCGGIWGYEEMLEVLKDKDDVEYENYLDWLGGEFDPEFFNKNVVNKLLKDKNYGCFEW